VQGLASPYRKKRVVRTRNAAMVHGCENIGATLDEIGREFNRSHATVLHGLRAERK
jgi:chromosomal replication initiation ATPase DnaA